MVVDDNLSFVHSVKSLTIVTLGSFTTIDKLLEFFDNLESLKIYSLDIPDNKLNDINFKNIRSLSLCDCENITDVGLVAISKAITSKLDSLTIFECDKITKDGVLNLISSDTTKFLYLKGPAVIKICGHLNTYKFLEHLHLCGNIYDSDLHDLFKFRSSMKHLEIGGWNITNYGIKSLQNIDIQHLSLYACSDVDDKSLKYVGHIPTIYFCGNILGDGLKYLSKCHEFLATNSICRTIDCFRYFDDIQILILDGCPIINEHLKYLNTPSIRKELNIYHCRHITNKGLVFVGKWQSIDVDNCDKIEPFKCSGTHQEVADEIMRRYTNTYLQL
uniref:Uncharacterized protein n=1 Tax=viral metagenome TaxID=1070528 RepID=A0A6C0C5Z4_9ZZZZ